MSIELLKSKSAITIGASTAESAQLLIASITDCAVYALDSGGRIATWNPGAERIKGYAPSEIVGRHVSVLYTSEDRKAGLPEQQLRAAADGHYETESWRVRKDGTRFWASVVITPLRDGRGAFLGYAKVARDLTERRKAEEHALAMQRAREAMRIRDDFIADAKRELDTATVTIRIHLKSLRAALGSVDDRTIAAIKAKAATLEWSIDRIIQSMNDVVALAEKAVRWLPGPPK
jgi:PAS domain S-box-containing protein